MKTNGIKRIMAVVTVFFCVAGLAACGVKQEEAVTGSEDTVSAEAERERLAKEDELPKEEEQGEEETDKQGEATPGDKIPMVMVDDVLYVDTGRESTVTARCGTMDGEITSSVDGSEIPSEDGQSNFGSGFGYQYGVRDTIEVYMNEKWWVFEAKGR